MKIDKVIAIMILLMQMVALTTMLIVMKIAIIPVITMMLSCYTVAKCEFSDFCDVRYFLDRHSLVIMNVSFTKTT